ncbi:hypothetical protein [Nocardia sp. NPDC052316]|uniref:hypothetical protein n=1 Tax=Nocardia sp. NPDC052316 TaxID=3364329 RepID=UPI0037CB3D50
MNPETNNAEAGFDTSDPALHLEYLYGPQWRDVVRIVERAAQLTPEEMAKLNANKDAGFTAGSSANESIERLLASFRTSTADTQTAAIAAVTAKEFGRTRAVQIAGLIAGQSITPAISGGAEGFGGLLASLGGVGALSTINRAVTAAVLGDLVGRGDFTRDVYNTLMDPWTDAIS